MNPGRNGLSPLRVQGDLLQNLVKVIILVNLNLQSSLGPQFISFLGEYLALVQVELPQVEVLPSEGALAV